LESSLILRSEIKPNPRDFSEFPGREFAEPTRGTKEGERTVFLLVTKRGDFPRKKNITSKKILLQNSYCSKNSVDAIILEESFSTCEHARKNKKRNSLVLWSIFKYNLLEFS